MSKRSVISGQVAAQCQVPPKLMSPSQVPAPAPAPSTPMSEACGCGASITNAPSVEVVRDWRTGHRHEAPPLRSSGSGGFASTERGYAPIGFSVPEQTRGM